MAYQTNDPERSTMTDDEIRRKARPNEMDTELQPDPELAEGPASGAKIAMFAIAIAVVLGAVFYGLNNTSVNQAGTTPPSQSAQNQPANPASPPNMPNANTQPGTTTGSATNRPTPPQSNPTGQEVDRSATPDSNK
jgi:hypothetical protein